MTRGFAAPQNQSSEESQHLVYMLKPWGDCEGKKQHMEGEAGSKRGFLEEAAGVTSF